MPLRTRRAWLPWFSVALLALLCATLAVLQYRWTGEIANAERARLQDELQSHLDTASHAFNDNLSTALRTLTPNDSQIQQLGWQAAWSAQYLQWKSTHPPLIERASVETYSQAGTRTLTLPGADPPRRNSPGAVEIPIHDIDAAVEEVKRAVTNGCKSLQLPVFPSELGLPDYWDERYNQLWAAIEDSGLPICCHIGMNTALDSIAQRDPTPQKGIFVPCVPLSAAEALGMWIMGGVFERYRDLKVVFVEPGIGWVAWWLYIADDLAMRQGYDFPAITELPSHYFHRNVFLTFIDEPNALRDARERLGVGNIMWSSDYPHPVSSWPHSHKVVDEMFNGIDPTERELIVSGNAARVWRI